MPLKRTLALLLTLSALMAMTSLSTDIYLPAMPVMERTLGGNAELTVTGFLIGFALAQLVWGPVSDRIGRKSRCLPGWGCLSLARRAAPCRKAWRRWCFGGYFRR